MLWPATQRLNRLHCIAVKSAKRCFAVEFPFKPRCYLASRPGLSPQFEHVLLLLVVGQGFTGGAVELHGILPVVRDTVAVGLGVLVGGQLPGFQNAVQVVPGPEWVEEGHRLFRTFCTMLGKDSRKGVAVSSIFGTQKHL